MNQSLINIIGINQEARQSALQADLNDIKEVKNFLDKDFEIWSDFDRWSNLDAQRWIFEKAIYVYKGKKLDIRCNCCDYIYLSNNNLSNKSLDKCNGLKIQFLINKIIDEIRTAEESRKNDGTYTA